MFEVFKKYLAQQVALTVGELKLIHALSIEKKIPKQEFILREGEISDKAIFITQGLLRLYRLDQKKGTNIS